jgi:hypothetical protein
MTDSPYTLVPLHPATTAWLIVRNNETYTELHNARRDAAERIVFALNATRHLATDAEVSANRGGAW